MKKIPFLSFLLIFCTSISTSITIPSELLSNFVANSEFIESNLSILLYESSYLLPLNKISHLLNIAFKTEDKITLTAKDIELNLCTNSHNAYLNNKKIHLITPLLSYNNQIYIPINLLNDLFDFYIIYDQYSNTLFLNKLSEFKQMEFFFGKVQNKLQTLNNINFDIITEIISKDNTSYSIGSSIYIDRTLNKIFQKNMTNDTWKEADIRLSKNTYTNFNNTFFTGISLDRINSTPNCLIFYGYYPLDDNKICYSKLFVDPNSLFIQKQLNEYIFEENKIKQTVFYSYN